MQKKEEIVKKSSRFSELWECIDKEIDFSIKSANGTLRLEKIVKKSTISLKFINLLKTDNSEIIAGIEEARESIKEEIDEKKGITLRIPDKFVEGVFGGYVFMPLQTTDYGKLYSYLGTYKAKSSLYEGMKFASFNADVLKQRSERVILDTETRNNEYRRIKYFMPGVDLMSGVISVFCNHGMSSEDYERFKIERLLNPAMENFMMSIL